MPLRGTVPCARPSHIPVSAHSLRDAPSCSSHSAKTPENAHCQDHPSQTNDKIGPKRSSCGLPEPDEPQKRLKMLIAWFTGPGPPYRPSSPFGGTIAGPGPAPFIGLGPAPLIGLGPAPSIGFGPCAFNRIWSRPFIGPGPCASSWTWSSTFNRTWSSTFYRTWSMRLFLDLVQSCAFQWPSNGSDRFSGIYAIVSRRKHLDTFT